MAGCCTGPHGARRESLADAPAAIIGAMIRLLVGLGNPGSEYAATRHNAGFWWLDAAAHKLGARLNAERSHHGMLGRVNLATGPLWLLEPMTFMNLSGQAVSSVARYFRIEPSEILVVHDDLDLAPGQAKLKFGGGHGGHNGLRDIHAHLATSDYWRLRLGIGHPGVKAEVVDYVLRLPDKEDIESIRKAIETSLGALDLMLAADMERAMMKIHAKPARPKPPRRDAEELSVPPEGSS
jgi:peptidyl-tRNA hydrolase, PTH1 family